MSTALQTAPQPTSVAALNTPPLVPASPANRPYASSHSSPAREAYHANPQDPTASSSSNRPSRKHSASDSPMSSRTAIASPVPVTGAASEYQPSSSDRRRNMATAVPPRTSSTQHTQGSASGGSSSRRAAYANDRGTSSSRRGPDSNGLADNGQPYQDEAAAQSSRSRRTHHAAQEAPQRSSSHREGRSGGPSREASEILNSILISQPEVDIERERERMALAQPHLNESLQDVDDAAPPPVVATAEHGDEGRRGGRSRHDHSKREKHTKFGEYILGNTIGEGEFGKVKLGWKQEGGVQVAIKLIKKDQLGNNPSRMAKIMREVAILKQLTHPNIVRLHKMEESERHYGIVLEYASGGELFDYILNHRYLKDNAARRLFAQLVSGVGYLHKKGIVHRDLKLENLLLDRNRNIIITDFGFANTFDPNEELSEEEELNLSDREFVKRMGLDKVKANGSRKGDLMQTSCGSPCYAAPELVVSDSLYTGRKVDVWSCGVILYAMLAGYLPFDDDPANPEGDNINLLYKYIVNTPLTFPEYVTPHARDLLRRILVPNPRKRADLFEVARHSWLSEYAHVVEFITSSTTTPGEIQNTTVPSEDVGEAPMLARSASVRESSKKAAASPVLGGLSTKQGTVDPEAEAAAYARQQRDNKRRTVQVEYVAPTTQTQRGEPSGPQGTPAKTRVRSGSQGPVEVSSASQDKPLPRDPPVSKDAYGKSAVQSRRPPSSHRQQNVLPSRPSREGARAASDNALMTTVAGASGGRPATGGSTSSRGLGAGPRSSYGQPLPPAVAGTNVHGRIQQPKGARNYNISNPIPQEEPDMDYGRPSISVPSKFARVSGFAGEGDGGEARGHKRSNTIGEIGGKIFGRNGSIFGGRNRKRPESQTQAEKSRKYPPVSMSYAIPNDDRQGRPSMDSKRSRRSFSIGLGRKRSGSIAGSQGSGEKHTRRFSLLPQSFSLKAIGIGKDYGPPRPDSQQDLPVQDPAEVDQYGHYVDQTVEGPPVDASAVDGMYAQLQSPQQSRRAPNDNPVHQRFASGQYDQRPSAVPQYLQQDSAPNTGSDSSLENPRRPPNSAPHQTGYTEPQVYDNRRHNTSRGHRGVLQKNKRFVDAYDTDEYSRPHDHAGSSGAARRVMDFFRRRGKARGGEDR
ncbi:Serine/threonine-protein kinase MARK2 [Pleurostoma richardsiae]|uniref:non-specific serine/threonine protein kinase n=1 Tax=Pleurostoma richardsiae TaxID=41990 RepID=A0AA38RIM5_9PEZI|nr:Serine/threonine-protein kinase MARK2 [Pleurostoma richardsiae]